jgi:hypothetical protein
MGASVLTPGNRVPSPIDPGGGAVGHVWDRSATPAGWPQFFHIGAPRTGTTTIQVTLSADSRVNLFRSQFFNTPLWYSGRPDFEVASDRVNVLSAETLVRKHEQRFKFPTTLEHIQRVAPGAQIILTIREQRAWLLSRYRWGVGSAGLCGSFEKWLRSPEGGDFLSIGRFATLLRFAHALFPREQVHVMLFEDLRDNYPGFFCRLYGLLGLAAPALRRTVANPSQPDGELVVRRMLNRLPFLAPGSENPMTCRKERLYRGLARLANRLAGRGAFAEWGTNTFFRRIQDDLRQSNAELQKLCGVDLAQHGYL